MDRALRKLAELRECGFQFMNLPDADGQLDRIMGFRHLRGYLDSLVFRSETEARAGRIPAVHASTRHVRAVWLYEGTLSDTIDRLLELPLPGAPTAPTLAKCGSAPDLLPNGLNPFQLWTPPGATA
ncbi:hypothetical protein GCM10010174_32120 [Kutzneria viridogrisea]|uniref:Uncharacterized protein n=2 Tax=Kutzneria TaxID=43356 RepID=W5VX76_9PSEU|nr:hypothetical protein [Kutzneria albida]AHH93443.1 hypothetical protein KALB_66 [Kutzneria albida DSM 43870]MBA8929172.1 hypothetical protein [Kutzneria viridogrisea]